MDSVALVEIRMSGHGFCDVYIGYVIKFAVTLDHLVPVGNFPVLRGFLLSGRSYGNNGVDVDIYVSSVSFKS